MTRRALVSSAALLAVGAVASVAAMLARSRSGRNAGDATNLRVEGHLESVAMVWPDADREDHAYETPEEAALAQPRRLDQKPRLVSVEMRNSDRGDVEIDMGRHPADRVLYRCSREEDGRWWVEGHSSWFDAAPVNIEAARPNDELGVYIVESPIGGYELVITGYDFRSTHLSHHATIEDAKEYADGEGLPALDWQPWTGVEDDT